MKSRIEVGIAKLSNFACFKLLVALVLLTGFISTVNAEQLRFKRIPLQYIAALASPTATQGTGAEKWGHWKIDPGPRGVRLKDYEDLDSAGGLAPAQWRFDKEDWWLEENGLIMEKPEFPLAPGRYLVTGGREIVTMLTVHPDDENGERRWELDRGANVFDVTHLACRSARYTPMSADSDCSPAKAPQSPFPLQLNAAMPDVDGCKKVDYAVLFLVGVEVTE
ncbi:MAG: hypothetical protein AAF420_05685 [Pseudomonadota bacterium]